MKKFFLCLLIVFVSLFLFVGNLRADEIEDLEKQINDLEGQLELSKKATTPLESEVKSLEGQLASIQNKIAKLQKDLSDSEEALEFQKEVMARTVRNFYMGGFVDIPLLTLLSSGDATETIRVITFQQESSRQDKQVIRNISEEIEKLASDKKRLAAASLQINKQSQFLKGEIASAKAFQSELEGKIAALTAR